LIIDLETVSTQWIARGLLDIILNNSDNVNVNNTISTSGVSSVIGSSSSSSNNNNVINLGNKNDHIQLSSTIIFNNDNNNNNTLSIHNLREEAIFMNIQAILPVILEWMNIQPIENGILTPLSSIKSTVLTSSPSLSSSSSTTTTASSSISSITCMDTYFPAFFLINNRNDGLNEIPISLHLPLHRLLAKIISFGAYGDVNLSRVVDYFRSFKIEILCNFIGIQIYILYLMMMLMMAIITHHY